MPPLSGEVARRKPYRRGIRPLKKGYHHFAFVKSHFLSRLFPLGGNHLCRKSRAFVEAGQKVLCLPTFCFFFEFSFRFTLWKNLWKMWKSSGFPQLFPFTAYLCPSCKSAQKVSGPVPDYSRLWCYVTATFSVLFRRNSSKKLDIHRHYFPISRQTLPKDENFCGNFPNTRSVCLSAGWR